jgi:hypothetical protein
MVVNHVRTVLPANTRCDMQTTGKFRQVLKVLVLGLTEMHFEAGPECVTYVLFVFSYTLF